MEKPEYLYHGSRKMHDILVPSQGVGYGSVDNEIGVYAVSEKDLAVAFAFSYFATGSDAYFHIQTTKPPCIVLKNTDVDWNRVGYVYKVRSDTFEQLDSDQWLSRVPVEPLEATVVEPEIYRDWVVFEAIEQ